MSDLAITKIGKYLLEETDVTYYEWFFHWEEWERVVTEEDNVGYQENDFIGFVSNAKTIRNRLHLAGYNDRTLEQDFNATRSIWIEELQSDLDRYELRSKRRGYDTRFSAMMRVDTSDTLKVFSNATFEEWKELCKFLVERKYKIRKDFYNEDLFRFFSEDISHVISDNNVGFAGLKFPCTQRESLALILLELCDDNDPCTLDITGLVRRGWITDKGKIGKDTIVSIASTKFYDNFCSSLLELRTLSGQGYNQTIQRMIYSNVITVMEVYLSDTMKTNVVNREATKRQFVRKSTALGREKNISLNDIYEEMEKIDGKIIKEIDETSFHNINIVPALFKSVLDCTFPEDKIGILKDKVAIRHDIVHRNGKDVNGTPIEITGNDIVELIDLVMCVITDIDKQVVEKIIN
ncbi:HEPN/Toprim-associated domain-containing protein [Aeromonas caviae]|uniref:HEPN/Toprim-associated domain-containing protein n=1 Tax=Aeromonas caviae TaxID=648 RepID=UPI0029DADB10|nr:HEPN/Toprim-associated domain-containing protein [Aeromonas caviae]MDX7825707.1 HEPN/Toprim-associated domain-containing protein [Aeromonas caviae]